MNLMCKLTTEDEVDHKNMSQKVKRKIGKNCCTNSVKNILLLCCLTMDFSQQKQKEYWILDRYNQLKTGKQLE